MNYSFWNRYLAPARTLFKWAGAATKHFSHDPHHTNKPRQMQRSISKIYWKEFSEIKMLSTGSKNNQFIYFLQRMKWVKIDVYRFTFLYRVTIQFLFNIQFLFKLLLKYNKWPFLFAKKRDLGYSNTGFGRLLHFVNLNTYSNFN